MTNKPLTRQEYIDVLNEVFKFTNTTQIMDMQVYMKNDDFEVKLSEAQRTQLANRRTGWWLFET
jgi:hypothetical protein